MSADQQARLGVELDYFGEHKTEWLAHRSGQYAVVKERELLGFYPSFETAYRAGAEHYGTDTDFLVKRILEYEPVFLVF